MAATAKKDSYSMCGAAHSVPGLETLCEGSFSFKRDVYESPKSTKSRKLLRFSPKNLRKRRTDKGVHGVAMATTGNDAHLPNGLPSKDKEMKEAFEMFDKNQDGKISSEELGGVLRTLGHDYTMDDIEDMIKHADTNENGYVEYDEFILLMKRWSTQGKGDEEAAATSDEDKTKETFKVFDMDGNGYIDRQELRYIMKRLGENLGDDDIQEMFRIADINGDGLIDYEEFTKLLGGIGGGGLGGLLAQEQPSSSSQKASKSSKSSGKKK